VLARTGLDIAGPLSAGQQLERRTTLTVPPDEATIAGYLVQQDYAMHARLHIRGSRGGEGTTPVRLTSAATDREWPPRRHRWWTTPASPRWASPTSPADT
jgi:hypothetical protein